jgi:hypothetical protein
MCYFEEAPGQGFRWRDELYAKINIENALSLGWSKQDILFFANFDWQHEGVRTLPMEGLSYSLGQHSQRIEAFKIWFLRWVGEKGLIQDVWFVHDIDLFQLYPFTDVSLLDKIAGLCRYSYNKKFIITGCAMWVTSAYLDFLHQHLVPGIRGEERFLNMLWHKEPEIRKKFKKMSRRWCFQAKHFRDAWYTFSGAEDVSEIMTLHVKPAKRRQPSWGKATRMWKFFRGKNKWKKVIVPDHFWFILHKYGCTGGLELSFKS